MAFTNVRVNAAVDAAVAQSTFVQLHDGDPGGAGTGNVAGEVAGRVAISFPAADDLETSDDVEFAITEAGGPYTHISLWSASTEGTFQGSASLSPAESFAGPGTLSVTVTVTGSST